MRGTGESSGGGARALGATVLGSIGWGVRRENENKWVEPSEGLRKLILTGVLILISSLNLFSFWSFLSKLILMAYLSG